MSVWSYVGAYMLGGLTLIPGVVVMGYYFAPQAAIPASTEPEISDTLSEQLTGPIQASSYFYLSPNFINLGEADDDFAPQVKARDQLKSSLDPAASKKTSLSKIPKYFGTVRGAILQLWADDTRTKLVSTIKLEDFVVTLWPQGAEDFELFYKKFPIVLISKATSDGLVSLDMHPKEPPPNSQFIYVDNPCAKEDLYFALIAGTRCDNSDTSAMGPRDPKVMAEPIEIDPEDIHELLNRIYSSNETPQTQWINALLGRLFLAVKFSRQLDDYIKYKIVYKLSKVKPSFIGDIEVQNIKVGSSLPYFNDIHLKSFSVDGNMTIEGNVVYSGGFSLDVVFNCYVKVPGLARREFRCVLAVKLQSLEGTLVIRVKPPPSSHLWYAFKEMPKMDLKIEPTVANRQVGYSFITSALNSMISDAVKESMVLPYMDDIPFCETMDEFYRGGIWDASQRPRNVSWQEKRVSRAQSYGSGHEVTLKDDASSTYSGKSSNSISTSTTVVGTDDDSDPNGSGATTPKPISKFWNNLLRRKASAVDFGMNEAIAAESIPFATSSAVDNNTTGYDDIDDLAPMTSSKMAYHRDNSNYSTTAVTPASVHGVHNKMYVPPETFAARKPVPATVTTANADFDPVKQPSADYTSFDSPNQRPLSVRRKPVGSGENNTIRPSRSLQQLNRVVSQAKGHSPSSSISGARRGHSPTSSISSVLSSSSSRMSNASHRRRLRLENLDPEPQPQPDAER